MNKREQQVYLVERTSCCHESDYEVQKIFFEEEKLKAKEWMDKKKQREKGMFARWKMRKFKIQSC